MDETGSDDDCVQPFLAVLQDDGLWHIFWTDHSFTFQMADGEVINVTYAAKEQAEAFALACNLIQFHRPDAE